MPEELLRDIVRASRLAHGLPAAVADPKAVQDVLVLLTGGRPVARAQARSASTGAGRSRLGAPDDLYPVGVEAVAGALGGLNHDMVDDCGGDRSLPGEVEGGPLGSDGVPVADESGE